MYQQRDHRPHFLNLRALSGRTHLQATRTAPPLPNRRVLPCPRAVWPHAFTSYANSATLTKPSCAALSAACTRNANSNDPHRKPCCVPPHTAPTTFTMRQQRPHLLNLVPVVPMLPNPMEFGRVFGPLVPRAKPSGPRALADPPLPPWAPGVNSGIFGVWVERGWRVLTTRTPIPRPPNLGRGMTFETLNPKVNKHPPLHTSCMVGVWARTWYHPCLGHKRKRTRRRSGRFILEPVLQA